MTTNVSVCVSGICPNKSFPAHLVGDWYSIDKGIELHTLISPDKLTNEIIESAQCFDISMIPDSLDAQGHYDAKVLLYNQ